MTKRSKQRRGWLRHCTFRIAFAVEPSEVQRQVVLVFHGAWEGLLHRVFGKLQGAMFSGYTIVRQQMSDMVNGKSVEQLRVTISNPNLLLISIRSWPRLITLALNKITPCEVTYCQTYEAFLNT